MSLFSWLGGEPEKLQTTTSGTTAEDRVIQFLFTQVKASGALPRARAAYTEVGAQVGQQRQAAFLHLYFELERYITASNSGSRPAYTVAMLRLAVMQHVPLNELPLYMKIIFVPPDQQVLYMGEFGIGYVAEFVTARLGADKLQLAVQNATAGTILRSITVGPSGIDFLALDRIAQNFTKVNIVHSFRALYTALCSEISRTLGVEAVTALFEDMYEFMKLGFNQELLAVFLETLPEGYLEAERLAVLTRTDLEQKASQALMQEKQKRELAEGLLEQSKHLSGVLEAERNRITAIVEVLGEGLLVVDQNLTPLLANPAAKRLLGLGQATALPTHITDALTMSQHGAELNLHEFLEACFKQGKVISVTSSDNVLLRTRDGHAFPIALTVCLLPGAGEAELVLVFRDISQEDSSVSSNQHAMSMAIRQLQDHVQPVKWFAEMLLKGLAGPLTPEQENIITFIRQSTDHAVSMVAYLVNKSQAGTASPIPLSVGMVNLVTLTNTALQSLSADAIVKGVQVAVESTPKDLPVIPADEMVLFQVIQNLLSNAIRYSRPNGKIQVHIILDASGVSYSVKDSGLGIPKDQQQHVFDKFFRARNASEAAPQGSGLGLNLVKMLVEGFGGSISFVSEEGKGSTFTFTIPVANIVANEPPIPSLLNNNGKI